MESISASSYIRNRGQVAGLSRTPDELWSGTTPSVKHLQAYGSKAYVSLEKHKRKGKMGDTKWEGVIVGYPENSVGYRVWDPVRGKVFNVGVPHVDEDVQPGWWKKDGGGGGNVDVDAFVFPDLAVDEDEGAAKQVQEQAPEQKMPELVEGSSNNDGDDVNDGDDRGWGPDDDADVDLAPGGANVDDSAAVGGT